MITGTTRLYPLIGHPVGQVRTPPAINAFFEDNDIDAVMVPLDLPDGEALRFLEMARLWVNCGGVSVTIPHKRSAFEAMDAATARARSCGSVNIVRRNADGTLTGDMTDGLAFVEALRRNGIKTSGRQVLLAGAAGATGSAIADALCAAGVAAIHLVDPAQERLQRIAACIAEHHPHVVLTCSSTPGSRAGIAVNATPLGMKDDDPLPFDPDALPADAVVADVVTRPEITPLLAKARDRGLRISTGFDMADAQLEFQMRHVRLWPHDSVQNTHGVAP